MYWISSRCVRRGWTLVELLVAVAILGVLIAILIPAASAAREMARRTQCSSNLRQLGLAVANYASVHGRVPSCVRDMNFSSHVALMPYLENEKAYFDLVEETLPRTPRGPLPIFHCPTTSGGQKHINYPASLSSDSRSFDGAFGFGWISRDVARWDGPAPFPRFQTSRGLSNVALFSELTDSMAPTAMRRETFRRIDEPLPWNDLDGFLQRCGNEIGSGTDLPQGVSRASFMPYNCNVVDGAYFNHVTPPNAFVCICDRAYGAFSANSEHSGGVFCVYGDAHVGFVTNEIDREIWSGQGDFR